jgi:hypothetical protein
VIKRPNLATAAAGTVILLGSSGCVTRQAGSIDCNFDRGGLIAQIDKASREVHQLSAKDDAPDGRADASSDVSTVDAGADTRAAEQAVAADGASPRR